jgi:hypothetical protein
MLFLVTIRGLYYSVMHVFVFELRLFPDTTVIYFISLSCHLLAETESCLEFFFSYHLLCECEYIVYLDFGNNYHCSLMNFSENEMVVICPETSGQLIVDSIKLQ